MKYHLCVGNKQSIVVADYIRLKLFPQRNCLLTGTESWYTRPVHPSESKVHVRIYLCLKYLPWAFRVTNSPCFYSVISYAGIVASPHGHSVPVIAGGWLVDGRMVGERWSDRQVEVEQQSKWLLAYIALRMWPVQSSLLIMTRLPNDIKNFIQRQHWSFHHKCNRQRDRHTEVLQQQFKYNS